MNKYFLLAGEGERHYVNTEHIVWVRAKDKDGNHDQSVEIILSNGRSFTFFSMAALNFEREYRSHIGTY